MSVFSLDWTTSVLEVVWEIYCSLLRIFPISSVAAQSSAMMRLSTAASLVLVAFCQSSSICLSCCSTPPACAPLLFGVPCPTTSAENTRVNSIAQIRDVLFISVPFQKVPQNTGRLWGNHAALYFKANRSHLKRLTG